MLDSTRTRYLCLEKRRRRRRRRSRKKKKWKTLWGVDTCCRWGGIENEKEEARFGCGGLFQSDIKRFDWGGVQSSISPS